MEGVGALRRREMGINFAGYLGSALWSEEGHVVRFGSHRHHSDSADPLAFDSHSALSRVFEHSPEGGWT